MTFKREGENFIQETLLDRLVEEVSEQVRGTNLDLMDASILTKIDSPAQGIHALLTLSNGEEEREVEAVVTVNGAFLLMPLHDNDVTPALNTLFS